ncbi:MAG TPA: hypothetical protein VIW23_08000 [Candidatus Acidoferrum sp.]|jgi:hypothetical protein
MTGNRYLHVRNTIAWLATTPLLWLAPPIHAQSAPTQSPTQNTGIRPQAQDNDTTRAELARFDQFLDSHQEVADQLRRDPSLVNNREFLEGHPALQTFLQDHPGIREEITENPSAFMRQENRFDRREDARDRDVTRGQLAAFDQFLDSHQEVSERLRRDPSLVDNREFLQSHPALQTFLQEHPGIREEIRENPNGFMRQEERFDRREDARDRDATRGQLAAFDQFLDNHREVSEQLRRDPSLVRNQQFVENHPALRTFLQEHPGIRAEIAQNPDAFMRQEERFDRREDAGNQGIRDRDTTRAELARFDQFLDNHREISEQLRKDPSLATNRQFVENHPALQTFLQQHPAIREEITENPNAFMRQENRFDRREDAANQGARDGDADRDDARRFDNRRDSNRQDADNRQDTGDRDVRDRDFARDDARRFDDRRGDTDNRQPMRDRDITHGQVVSFDQFLDKHREIDEQVSRDPSLLKNQQFLDTHPALQAFLQAHKGVSTEISENPNAFMQQEKLYESQEKGMGSDMGRSAGTGDMGRERASFGEFLGGHSGIADQISKNPSLVKNQEFMANHPELQSYLKAHPAAQAEMTQNPGSFIKAAQQYNSTKTGTSTSGTATGTVKTTTPDANKPPKP